jgi:CheY-like chemotaxis protein
LCGFSVVTADDPLSAISMMSEDRVDKIDVAVLDYNMPVMNGCALADRLRSVCPELKIILYSGAINIPRTEIASVDAFIPKDEGTALLLAQIVEFAQVGRWPHPTVAPDMELSFRAQSGRC